MFCSTELQLGCIHACKDCAYIQCPLLIEVKAVSYHRKQQINCISSLNFIGQSQWYVKDTASTPLVNMDDTTDRGVSYVRRHSHVTSGIVRHLEMLPSLLLKAGSISEPCVINLPREECEHTATIDVRNEHKPRDLVTSDPEVHTGVAQYWPLHGDVGVPSLLQNTDQGRDFL